MSKIETLDKLKAQEAAQKVHEALQPFPMYMLFATNGVNGFFQSYPPEFADMQVLKQQIIQQLKNRPELTEFFREILPHV